MAKGKQNTKTNTIIIIATAILLLGVGGYFLFRKKPEDDIVKDAYDSLLFSTGTASIMASSHASLNELAEYLMSNPSKQLRIVGHTDNTGSDSSNLVLSQKRADAVKKFLLQKGVPPTTIIESIGMGETSPIASNDTAEGREMNRRVEFII